MSALGLLKAAKYDARRLVTSLLPCIADHVDLAFGDDEATETLEYELDGKPPKTEKEVN